MGPYIRGFASAQRDWDNADDSYLYKRDNEEDETEDDIPDMEDQEDAEADIIEYEQD